MVQFYPWRKFHFLLFQAHYVFIIHYHTQKQKKTKFKPRIKLNHTIYIYNQWSCKWCSGFSLSAGNWLKSCPFRVMWESESPKLPSGFDHQTAYFSILAVYQKHNENSWCFKQPDWFAISGYLTILLNEAEYDVKNYARRILSTEVQGREDGVTYMVVFTIFSCL